MSIFHWHGPLFDGILIVGSSSKYQQITLMTPLLWWLSSFLFGIVFASFFEWKLHRDVMHKPVRITIPFWKTVTFAYAFHAHAVVHHRIFGADKTYHLQKKGDEITIPMAWWNGPVLIAIGTSPFVPLSYVTGLWSITFGIACAFTCYYLTYEFIHWCFHLPKNRQPEKFPGFRLLKSHHLLHHLHMGKNFNVVLPLADICLGTFVWRAKRKFDQPRHSTLRDVQPKP